ncbi:MAG: two-component regulator propeller domain-containing protein, partial [Saprospiraceae bacterium]|nr:two-component regulator propeller domain-containing protein [Saprospiraceae bacterium]
RVCPQSPTDTANCGEDLNIYSLCQDHQGWMWVGTNRGLYAIKGDSTRHFRFRKDDLYSLSGSHVYELFEDSRHQLWAGTNNGPNLLARERQGFVNHRNNDRISNQPVLSMGEDARGTLWVSLRFHDYRMHWWDPATRAFVADPRFQMPGEFRFTFADDNRLWISSRAIGCYVYDPQSDQLTFFNPLKAEHHGYQGLYSFDNLEDRYGNIWIIAEQVVKWPATHKDILTIRGDGQIISAVYADDKYVWYCAGKPWRWNRRTREVEDYWPEGIVTNRRQDSPGVPNFAQITEYQDLDADHLVFSTTRNLFIWNRHDDSYRQLATRYGGPFRDIAVINSDSVWALANQDPPILFEINEPRWRIQWDADRIAAPTSVDLDETRNPWIGTMTQGVFRYDHRRKTFAHYDQDNSALPSNYVTTVLCDPDGTVWAGTNLGLAHID